MSVFEGIQVGAGKLHGNRQFHTDWSFMYTVVCFQCLDAIGWVEEMAPCLQKPVLDIKLACLCLCMLVFH